MSEKQFMKIENWKTNSREVTGPEDIFVALKGYHTDGHAYIDDAIARGARFVVSQEERKVPEGVSLLVVPDPRQFLKDTLKKRFLPYFADLRLIGVTGTNGKTTTCYIIYQLLGMLGVPCAYIGTIGFYCPGEFSPIPNTTPDTLLLYQLLTRARKAGCEAVVMEVSSHSLAEHRVDGLSFEVAAFSNLTRDHLDYHKSMEAYLEAKKTILNYLKPGGSMVINCDDPAAEAFRARRACLIRRDPERIRALSALEAERGIRNDSVPCRLDLPGSSFGPEGAELLVHEGDRVYVCHSSMPNELNADNLLMAAVCLRELGIPLEKSLPLAGQLHSPAGRFETYSVNGGLAVVDYAHNADAISRVLDLYQGKSGGKLYCVLGCAGERDRGKRPMIGKLVTDRADFVVFTNDDPHAESPEQIMGDILSGIDPGRSNYLVEYDREKAIRIALDRMEEKDTVLILGKGHEKNIVFSDHVISHNDGDTIRRYTEEKGA